MAQRIRTGVNPPEAFLESMRGQLGGEYGSFIDSYNEPPVSGLRINRLKIKAEEAKTLLPFPLTPVKWCDTGFIYPADERPARHWAYHAGLFYIQEPSAMYPAELLDPKPGDRVLDICAAPGGKSAQIAGRLAGEGALVSNDASASRCGALIKNLELAGVTNAAVLNEQPKRLAARFAGYFDKILADAPCSGEGMFRRDASAAKAWAANKPNICANAQREILHYAAAILRPGGSLVYSTCTFNATENEGVIKEFLSAHNGFRCIEQKRIWPHRENGEGHFAALLKRAEAPRIAQDEKPKARWQIDARKSNALNRDAFRPFKQFCDDYLSRFYTERFGGGRLAFHENSLFLIPEGLPGLSGLRVMRGGWYLGDVSKGRFIPSQAFAMGLAKDEARFAAELTDGEIIRYLKGETVTGCKISGLQAGDKPWVLACAYGFPLGWGRLADGQLKNRRPKGWAVNQ